MRKPSHKDGQTQPMASISLGPVHPSKVSKVSKASGKKRPGPQRRPNASQDVSSGDALSFSGPDIAEKLPQTTSVPPRRSKRIRPPEPSKSKDSTGIASTDSRKTIAGSRPKRKVAGNSKSTGSAKPQGISKRQRPNTTRGKTRKDTN
jgi:hypothetical protein